MGKKKKSFFKKMLSVIPSALLSSLPNFCHSFRIFVIPSEFLSFLPNIVIPSKLLSFWIAPNLLPYPKAKKIGQQSRSYLQVFSKLLQSLKFFDRRQYLAYKKAWYINTIHNIITCLNVRTLKLIQIRVHLSH